MVKKNKIDLNRRTAGKAKRVAVALSGGIDSSVAAAILKDQGFDVIGITMSFNLLDAQVVEKAQRVAHSLGIRHYVLDLTSILKDKVIDNFFYEYLCGRTPNPCLRCNQYVKFGALLRQALIWDCDFLATGHYAKRLKTKQGFLLKKGKDRNKDQSYFLYRLSQKQLRHVLFPLGDLTRKEVVGIARRLNLPAVKGRQSQEICFLRGEDYRGFLKERITAKIRPGKVLDKAGNVLGQHQGIPFYTLGQREGLNIALGYRAYVIRINAAKNQIILGRRRDACTKELTATQPSFIRRPLKKRVVCKVKIRYNHREQEAEILPQGRNLRVRFRRAQFAITPGQSAVFYQGDMVVGGGIIR
jgi:tRNA-specific 2-thiouridylase